MSSVFNTTTFNDRTALDGLEKWTVYCVNVSGYTSANIGPSETECVRTYEDGKWAMNHACSGYMWDR